MYQINPTSKRIRPLTVKSFTELGFTERYDLQEWISHEPESLGEELLIIQKEFDGFDDTRERLDLLALDKQGNLVIIENKLDDSGRDVVWQALKYASYCSSLSKQNILDIYQKYLAQQGESGQAGELIGEFLEAADIEEVVLNPGNRQRIILVAAKFRKEVTSTALWLLGHGIELQCMKVTPYAMGETLLLNVEQIIPTPEAKELMIGMSIKEAQEKTTEVALHNRHKLRLAFWEQALDALGDSACSLYNNVNPGKDHWLSAGSGLRACPYTMIFAVKEVRVELDMSRSVTAENKFIFDTLYQQKDAIESKFGQPLEWLRMDEKKASRVQLSHAVDGYDKANWPEMIAWLVEHLSLLEGAFKGALQEVSRGLKDSLVKPVS